MISYILGPNPVLQFTDNEGNYLSLGSIQTLDWDTRQPKATYFDPGGLKPRDNPFSLDNIGRAFEVYWEDDTAYYLRALDRFGNEIWESAEPYIPGAGGGGVVTTNIEFQNLFINGQQRFFAQGVYEPIPVGETTDVAEGGWSFIKDGMNPTDKLEFVRFTLDNSDVDATPIYYINYVSTGVGVGQTENDYAFKIQDVRSLSNEQVSVGVAFRSLLGGVVNIEIIGEQNFGTSSGVVVPSTPVLTTLGTFAINTAWNDYTVTATLPDLVGKTIGDNGDDFLKIRFRFPLNTNADIEATNFYLKRGSAPDRYPYQTYAEVLAELQGSTIPPNNPNTDFPDSTYPDFSNEQAYDSLSLIPMDGKLIKAWYSAFPIGGVMPFPSDLVPPSFVQAAGQALLQAGEYNRLYNVPFQTMGKIFGNAYGTVSNNVFAGPGPGGDSTKFTGVSNAENATNPWSAGTSTFNFIANTPGHANPAIVATSAAPPTWSFSNTANGAVSTPQNTTPFTINVLTLGSPTTPAMYDITFTPASTVTASEYFTFQTSTGFYYWWFEKDGIGTDPALPGFTQGYKVAIETGYTADDLAVISARAIEGQGNYTYTALAASAITPGAYIEVGIVGATYLPYYKIDGAGDAPTVPSTTPFPIDILSTDTASEVATKTANLLNPMLWQMPDWRGAFLRGWDNGRGLDPDAASRLNRGDGTVGDNVGTFQGSEYAAHTHPTSNAQNFLTTSAGPGAFQAQVGAGFDVEDPVTTGLSGGNETRPVNYSFNICVKY